MGNYARLTPIVVMCKEHRDVQEILKLNPCAFNITSPRDAYLLAFRVQEADVDVPTAPIYAVRSSGRPDKPTGIWVGVDW